MDGAIIVNSGSRTGATPTSSSCRTRRLPSDERARAQNRRACREADRSARDLDLAATRDCDRAHRREALPTRPDRRRLAEAEPGTRRPSRPTGAAARTGPHLTALNSRTPSSSTTPRRAASERDQTTRMAKESSGTCVELGQGGADSSGCSSEELVGDVPAEKRARRSMTTTPRASEAPQRALRRFTDFRTALPEFEPIARFSAYPPDNWNPLDHWSSPAATVCPPTDPRVPDQRCSHTGRLSAT